MEYTIGDNKITVKGVKVLDLKNTLDCGQCFRWSENPDNSFTGIAYNREITVRRTENDFVFENTNEKDFLSIWYDYFDFSLDYEKVVSEISQLHPVLSDAVKNVSGIRVLKQEPFEALCTFIISQNNNIPRIKGIVKRLCESFGEPIASPLPKTNGENREISYSFPSCEKLASLTENDLIPLRAGFRNGYILDAARKVSSGIIDLESLRNAEFEKAEETLMQIVGVGKKVADCTLLYGLHRIEAFPLDVWMKRAMEKIFTGMIPQDFGKYAGIAQQYIFHYSRTNPNLFDE